ncbi:MAG: hypothetical protein AUI58_01525 [Chloroflexi bacterium 13_1_40CM_2_70_6]|nr:MAG: hypothetical protein AUI58_01525 [Chloroflexi bacterium 13_1_40CM_2_70_6]
MERSTYNLTVEPRGQTYKNLLTAALPYCDEFLFVDVPWARKGKLESSFQVRARELVRELEPHLVRVERSMSWPGTVLSERRGLDIRAYVYRYRFEPKSLSILTRVADRLYEWCWPELPAGLCLLRADGEAWLVTMADHDDCYLTLTKDEAAELARVVPGLNLRRHYSEH